VFLLAPNIIRAATLQLGRGKQYPAPCAAIADVVACDTIGIDAGLYRRD